MNGSMGNEGNAMGSSTGGQHEQRARRAAACFDTSSSERGVAHLVLALPERRRRFSQPQGAREETATVGESTRHRDLERQVLEQRPPAQLLRRERGLRHDGDGDLSPGRALRRDEDAARALEGLEQLPRAVDLEGSAAGGRGQSAGGRE